MESLGTLLNFLGFGGMLVSAGLIFTLPSVWEGEYTRSRRKNIGEKNLFKRGTVIQDARLKVISNLIFGR